MTTADVTIDEHSHTPFGGNRQPVSTYRLQLGPDLSFDQARKLLPYLESLGVTDLYLSPILEAAPGSTHGYDVVDHSIISTVMGGEKKFVELAEAAHRLGMGVVVDVVPNHMAVPVPLYLNKALWSVLRDGPSSEFASWFDIELEEEGDGLLMPILGERIGSVLAQGQLELDTMVIPGYEDEGEQPVLKYFDHVFPVRRNTESLPMIDLVDRQFYRLAYWRVANEELNYRRFFDVDTLAAVRVEDEEVFDATHALLLKLFHAGHIDAFRIDHPDGLADPRGYFRQLSAATNGAWIAGEKILDGDELLPGDWPIAGTTGYAAAWRIQSLMTDPGGILNLGQVMNEIAGDAPGDLPRMIADAKREVISMSLIAEIERLTTLLSDLCREDVRLRDHTQSSLRDCVIALMVEMDRYRAYVVPGETPSTDSVQALQGAAERARKLLPDDRHETLEVVLDLLLGKEIGSAGRTHDAKRAELIVRFQQTCGPVMAKGVEDTAFYRWTMLLSSCEVGSDPRHPAISSDDFHSWLQNVAPAWPAEMTCGTTHDTKRGEDVRARIGVISQYSEEWKQLIAAVRERCVPHRPSTLDGRTENMLWQTIAGTWMPEGPINHDRLTTYLRKASREQKTWTTWTNPNEEAEEALFMFARYALTDTHVTKLFADWFERTSPAVRSALLATKAIQLTMLGVADLYQGEEITQNSLVDPDNRRPVDYGDIAPKLESFQDLTALPSESTLDEEKLWLTHKILRLRKELPTAFVGSQSGYRPLPVTTGHAFAFARTIDHEPAVVTVTERLHSGVASGYGHHSVVLPEGTWTDILTGNSWDGGSVQLADLLAALPVAVLRFS